jgi:hypothetical protein
MIQIFINEQELDLPANIGEQIAINYEAFPLGEFRNTFNNFSGNLNFPPTAKNRLIFGHATNNLAPLTITREYTGRIVSGAIELFFGRVDYERYNNGFECRFVTSGQLLSEEIKQYDMFDVMYGLPRADAVSGEQWFDHKYEIEATPFGVGEIVTDVKNVRYPLMDLGYFNNTNDKIGYFDLRPAFNLWIMCLAIAKKVNKNLLFSGTLPERLQNTFITLKEWKYSDRFIESTKTATKVLPFTTSYNYVARNSSPLTTFNTMTFSIDATSPLKVGEFELITDSGFLTDVRTPFDCNFNVNAELSFKCIIDYTSQFNQGTLPSFNFWLETITSVLFDNVDSVAIQSVSFIDGEQILGTDTATGSEPLCRILDNGAYVDYCNPELFSGQYKIRLPLLIRYQKNRVYEGLIEDARFIPVLKVALAPYGGDSTLDQSISISFNTSTIDPNVPDFILQHNNVILGNGFISGADLMGTLKPADVLKYAMRLSGSYLIETDTAITLVPFSDYDKAEAQDWSGKVNFLQPPIVDYRDNELGKDNWLVYKQDDTNTALDPYYLGGNLPTNLGTTIATLYEAPFAQSAFNQTFEGSTTIVRIPYYNAPLAYIYRVWLNDSTTFNRGQYVGFEGRLFKVLNNTTGSAGTPLVNTSNYEEVDYSIFNEQSPEYRAIEVLTEQITRIKVYNDLGNAYYIKDDTAALNGIDFAQAITDGYGFIPSTFLDYRQVVVQVSLSDLDIHNLDLKKLVFISELNAYFYINKVEEYTPATNVDTTVTLTMLP